MKRKVLMLASKAEVGPKIPYDGKPYKIEVEGGGLEDFFVNEIDGKYLQVVRLHGYNPITVYANCE